MNELAWFLALAGVLTAGLHLWRLPLQRVAGLTALAGLLVGVVVGPHALDLLHPSGWAQDANSVVLWATRLALAPVLMATIMSLPPALLQRQRPALWGLLLARLALRWLVGAAAAYFLAHFTLWGAMLAGAVLAPVDPVLAGSLAGVLRCPRRVIHLVAAEGVVGVTFMLPVVLLSALLLVPPAGGVTAKWVVDVLLWQTLGGAVLGAALGRLAGTAAHPRRGLEFNLSWLSAAVALALVGAATAMGLNEIAAVVAAGVTFARTSEGHRQARRQQVSETVQGFLVLPAFLILGALLPLSAWHKLGLTGLVAAAVIVVVGRLPWAPALAGPWRLRAGEVLPTASLGAMAVASLYLVARVEELASIPPLWWLTTLTVALSVLLSATLLTLRPAPADITSNPDP